MDILPIIINILIICLLVICIILGIKLIITMNKINKIADQVNEKINSLNGVFEIINSTSEKINSFYLKLINLSSRVVDKFIMKNRNKFDEEEEDE